MNKLDIYEALVSTLTDTMEWRTEHPKLANAYVDGALDMCIVLIDKINKEGDSDEKQSER